MSTAKDRIRRRFDQQKLAFYGTVLFVGLISFVGVVPRLFLLLGLKSYGDFGADLLIIASILVILSVVGASVVGFQLSQRDERAQTRVHKD